jgi:hypothetical protein
MKKGYLSPFHLGALEAISHVLEKTAEISKQQVTNSNAIFYATAFQSGIDELLIHDKFRDDLISNSEFIASRTTPFSNTRSNAHSDIINATFSAYLPDDWRNSIKFHSVSSTTIFINDLIDAMSAGSCLISTGRLHLIEIRELLPDELFVPLSNLLLTLTTVQTPSPIPQNVISTDDIRKFDDIISSDLFGKYVNSQSALDNSEVPIDKALPVIVSTGRMLFSQNRSLLALRNASVNILQVTPKLVDAVFGKLPGALAEVAAKLGISFLEDRRRLVIYDFHEFMFQEVLFRNLMRMLKATEATEPEQGG